MFAQILFVLRFGTETLDSPILVKDDGVGIVTAEFVFTVKIFDDSFDGSFHD